jgi:hypothetical protein
VQEIQQIITATRDAYRVFATTPGASPQVRQAVAQAVRFLIADLTSAQEMTGALSGIEGKGVAA